MCRIFAVKILTWWLHIYDDTFMVNQRHIYGAMHATRTRGVMPLTPCAATRTRQHERGNTNAATRTRQHERGGLRRERGDTAA